MQYWVENYFFDFETDDDIMQTLNVFIKHIPTITTYDSVKSYTYILTVLIDDKVFFFIKRIFIEISLVDV